MEPTDLNKLICYIDPRGFSPQLYGNGIRIGLSGGKAECYRGGFVDRLRRGGNYEREVFVKHWPTPYLLRDWRFQWSEGTTAITLDFVATFTLQANEESQALGLARALCRTGETPRKILHDLIASSLQQEMDALFAHCQRTSINVLDYFAPLPTGVGNCPELSQRISTAVARHLQASVRIGLDVIGLPPRRVEVRSTDAFRLKGSDRDRHANTAALLHLDNYQAFKRSGLADAAAIEDMIRREIAAAVRDLLFEPTYYDVVGSLAHNNQSIGQAMEARIRAAARAVGYSVQTFQTFPDIAALALRDGLRIDIGAEDAKFALLRSTGSVQIKAAIKVSLGTDVSRLHQLVPQDADDVRIPISEQIKQICRDVIQRVNNHDFHLRFEDSVVPLLHTAIVTTLARYGVQAEVINIDALPTEESERYRAICGRTFDFSADVSAQADATYADPATVLGSIEINGLADDGWPQFENKDFGFREDSHFSEASLRHAARGPELPAEASRRELAIRRELDSIKERVVATLCKGLAMKPELVSTWCSTDSDSEIADEAQKLVREAIAREFGLFVTLHSFRRGDTPTEIARKEGARIKREFHLQNLHNTAVNTLEARKNQRELAHETDAFLAKQLAEQERNAFDNAGDARHDEALARAKQFLARGRQDIDEEDDGLQGAAGKPKSLGNTP